ncbi:MAG: hypothetical protein AAF716_00085 [Cyanobacteria bacterium P01_D01_bin.1]
MDQPENQPETQPRDQLKDQLKNQLDEWVRSLHSIQQIIKDESGNIAMLLQRTNAVQSQFQEIIEATSLADLPLPIEQKMRPYQTEAHRRLRLLSVASMKLKTARAPDTVAQVRSQLEAHLEQIEQFAIAMANEIRV